MFTNGTHSVRPAGLEEAEAVGSEAPRRTRSVRRAAVTLAIGGSLLVSAISAGPALADQYPPGSLYGTEYGAVANDSVPKGPVDVLTNLDTGLVAEAPSTTVGAQMIQTGANGGFNQTWAVEPSGAYYQLQNRQSGLCLEDSGTATAQDAPVIQSSCSSAVSQQWKLTTQSGGLSIINANTGGYLAVAGGEKQAPSDGAGLVQDLEHKNHADSWTQTPASYQILTDLELATGHGANDPPSLYFVSSQYDATQWTCLSGYHFRMHSAGTYDSANNRWKTLPQAEVDQALTPEVVPSSTDDNIISTQQSPDGGQFPFISPELSESQYDTLVQQPISWTNATVSSSEGNGVSDGAPSAANAGVGTVSITYGYTTAFQGADLQGQVILHCDPNPGN
ncbi:MAG: RICIN domain-containing protein [Solirubrobacterales bacterium]|nr:RICIN domain-containing protein [Solirubrobacterales bacterium]MBV9048381.1 RICIN domain-containing protein [Solirubrobacterales bacterium]